MNITIGLSGPELNDEKLFAEFVVAQLESLVPAARLQMQRLPPLYQSGIRFRPEPEGTESFVLPLVTYSRGFGDCAHLSLIRVAELRNAREKAGFRIKWSTQLHPVTRLPVRLFHVQVRRRDGNIEDPSQLLGMPSNGAV